MSVSNSQAREISKSEYDALAKPAPGVTTKPAPGEVSKAEYDASSRLAPGEISAEQYQAYPDLKLLPSRDIAPTGPLGQNLLPGEQPTPINPEQQMDVEKAAYNRWLEEGALSRRALQPSRLKPAADVIGRAGTEYLGSTYGAPLVGAISMTPLLKHAMAVYDIPYPVQVSDMAVEWKRPDPKWILPTERLNELAQRTETAGINTLIQRLGGPASKFIATQLAAKAVNPTLRRLAMNMFEGLRYGAQVGPMGETLSEKESGALWGAGIGFALPIVGKPLFSKFIERGAIKDFQDGIGILVRNKIPSVPESSLEASNVLAKNLYEVSSTLRKAGVSREARAPLRELATQLFGPEKAVLGGIGESIGVPRPVPSGHIRLYRGESAAIGKLPPWMQEATKGTPQEAASGRWFTENKEALKWYLKDAGPTAKTTFVDIPKADLEKYRVINQSQEVQRFSRDPRTEFFLPKEMADKRQYIAAPERLGNIPQPEKFVGAMAQVVSDLRAAASKFANETRSAMVFGSSADILENTMKQVYSPKMRLGYKELLATVPDFGTFAADSMGATVDFAAKTVSASAKASSLLSTLYDPSSKSVLQNIVSGPNRFQNVVRFALGNMLNYTTTIAASLHDVAVVSKDLMEASGIDALARLEAKPAVAMEARRWGLAHMLATAGEKQRAAWDIAGGLDFGRPMTPSPILEAILPTTHLRILQRSFANYGGYAALYERGMIRAEQLGLKGGDRAEFLQRFIQDAGAVKRVLVTDADLVYARNLAEQVSLTLQAPLGEKMEKWMNPMVQTFLAPYPRFLSNAIRMMSEMTPLSPTFWNKLVIEKTATMEDVTKFMMRQFSGFGGVYAVGRLIAPRVDFNEMVYRRENGQSVPFSRMTPLPELLAVDAMLRGDYSAAIKAMQAGTMEWTGPEAGGLFSPLRRVLSNVKRYGPEGTKQQSLEAVGKIMGQIFPGRPVWQAINGVAYGNIAYSPFREMPGGPSLGRAVLGTSPFRIERTTGEPLSTKRTVLGLGGPALPLDIGYRGLAPVYDPVRSMLEELNIKQWRPGNIRIRIYNAMSGQMEPFAPLRHLNFKQQQTFDEAYGKAMHQLLTPLATDKKFRTAPAKVQTIAVNKAVSAVHKMAFAAILQKYPGLMKQWATKEHPAEHVPEEE